MASAPEIIVPLSAPRDRIAPVSRVRGTLLLSSLRSIRARGLLDRYLAGLPAADRETIQSMVATTWLSMDLALAHYGACDALMLSARDQIEIGREVGANVQGTILGTLVKMAKGAGATPWAIFCQYQKLWDRLLVGGGIVVTKHGPKEATFEYVNLPLVKVAYFRMAFRGVNMGACELFSQKVYADEVTAGSSAAMTLTIRLSWV